jgi:peptide/nickel transport system substrate-binding protein
VSTLHCRLLVLTLVAAAGVCAFGCGRRDTPAPGPVTMRIGVGAPPRGTARAGAGNFIQSLMSETWLVARPDGLQSERIVVGWDWDGARTTLHLKLHPDVYFHDGTRLTPELAAQVLRNSAAKPEQEGILSFTSIRSVTASGEDSITINLSEPNSFVLPDLALAAVLLPGHADLGTGPFRIVKRDAGAAVLTAFPQYYRGRPGVAEIDVMNYPTQRKAWAALMRSEIDMLYEVSRDAVDFVEAETTVKTYSFPRPYYIPLVFSVRHPVLRNAEVRKAINEALDRATLIRDGLNGRGRPADGPILPEHWAYASPAQPFVFNPDAARLRLDAAGLPARSSRDGNMPARFSFTCLVFANDARFERLAVLAQKQLADVGIDMKLLPLTQPELVPRLASGDFDAFLFEMFGRPLSSTYDFWRSHEGSHVNTGYRAADAVLDRMRSARSEDDVRAAVADLATILHDDPPAAFLAWQATSRAVSTNFDVAAEPNRDILTSAWQWRPAAGTKQAAR